jgi:hypothetical protein
MEYKAKGEDTVVQCQQYTGPEVHPIVLIPVTVIPQYSGNHQVDGPCYEQYGKI